MTDSRPAVRPGRAALAAAATGPLLLIAAALAAVLLAVSARYGYHRDELYFLEAGRHLAWGYPDQPPLTPALAALVDGIAPDSLVVLRVLPALTSAATVLLTGLLARELGGGRGAQLLAAGSWAVSAVVLITGHMFSTTAFDLLAWVATTWVAARLLRGGDPRWWLALGVIVGLGLQNKSLLVVLPLALLAGVLIAGPREVLRSKWFAVSMVLAAAIVLPNLIWQATNGWPQLALSGAIAAGESGTSEPRWLFLPFQLVLVSPAVAPIWIAGLVALFRAPALRRFRGFGWAYALLALAFLAMAGKPYYLAGMYPVLIAAGAPVFVGWLRNASRTHRIVTIGGILGISAVINAILMLPVLPADVVGRTPVIAVNYDAGETIGWPEFTSAVAAVVDALPPAERDSVVLLTGNYGEAGALDRYGAGFGLPAAYSRHNAYHSWGPPPDNNGADVVVAVGLPEQQLSEFCGSLTAAGTVDNGLGVDNDEQGRTIWVCRDLTRGWAEVWPGLLRLG